MDEKTSSAEQMPQTIGRYQVLGSIGFGAMGAVYKAFDPLIKRTLAIKTIRLDIPRQSPQYKSFIERFYHEARISGTLSHPNIVTLFDIGEESSIPYLAMEFVEGETIASMIEKGVKFNPEKVISLVSQIASAVDYAHGRGVIHRDIKPSNLIMFESERVKVTDFGIAKLVDAEMTQSGTLLGTPSYMSPEQAMGDKLDGRSDIFSLGVCAFEMLSGEQPFPGNNVTSILYKLVHVDPIEPANLEMHGLVPQKWHDVFGKVLAKKPDDRYQTATEFVQDLEYCLGSWFGSAMGDETITDGAAMPALAAPESPDTTRSLPKVTLKPDDGATHALPAVKPPPPAAVPTPAPSRAATAAAPKPAPPPPDDGEGDLPATINMKAPQLDDPAVGKTVVMSASQIPQAKDAKDPKKTKPPAEAPTVGATVMMSAADVAAASAPPSDATIKQPIPVPPKPTPPPVAAKPAPVAKPAPPPTVPAPVPVVTVAGSVSAATTPAPIPAAARPRSGVSAGLILGGAAVLFLLALVGAGIIIYRSQQQAADPTPSAPTTTVVTQVAAPSPVEPTQPPAPTGALHVESQPPGATVTVNGEAKGVTPLDLPGLPLASYEVKLDLRGFEPRTQSVSLTAEAPQGEVKLPLVRMGPAMGTVDVLSTPFGAAVSVDGARVGVTPLTDQKLRVGTHQVEVAKEGYEPQVSTLKVEVGKRARVDVNLRAMPKPSPSPVIEAVDVGKVYALSEVDAVPKKASGQSPSYPKNAPNLRSGDSVSTAVGFVVTETGEVTELKIVESAGKIVDEAVMNAIRGWKYAPGVKRGVKVKVRITFKQTFRAG
jgi:TonB family protein